MFDIQALWRLGLSARVSKIKNGGLDQYGAEPQFGTAGVEGVNVYRGPASVAFMYR